MPVNYGTAYAALVLMAAVRQGETVLVHAAAGGVGIAALQMLRDARRRGDRHRLRLQARRDPGAGRRTRDRLPHPGREEEVDRITGGKGVDVVLDALGEFRTQLSRCCARAGGS